MKSNSGLIEAIVELSHERGLDQDTIIEAIEDAIVGAAYKKYKNQKNIEAVLNRKTGEVELMYFKTVVESVDDPYNQIDIEEVRKLDPDATPGDEVEFGIDAKEFQSVIAQTARQLIFQKINEAERESILEKYKEKVGEIIHGQVARIERGRTVVMIGHTVEAGLERREQIPFEKLQPGDNIRALLLEIRTEGRGPQLVLTRTHPNFLMKLMEVEVPEVFDGIIDVMGAAREPGRRAKVSVKSNDPDVDPVGACVGVRGSRIQAVVSELCGERIDVVEYSEDLSQYIASALAPAEIVEMTLDENGRNADIKVLPDQLSLAIGKQGQNVRLASKLTGVSINIGPWESHDPFEEQEAKAQAAALARAEAEYHKKQETTNASFDDVEGSEKGPESPSGEGSEPASNAPEM
ncbi:MAG: transcription termination factor NusA [Candidatus Lambdaproteobacteria bacterium RIFOXYD1_FULL_56_27]|uniref:Transcription termination/antitermination protein NusA n=1 Tax=Candidatus Lambdaproteobacteria bacterium RIFOXYD2_FULL_56_26 TaxID=1817773 RepID=A0A1F6GZQ6_9PROT|nr:MAG: transcription termination factor NusA [Candidatus Lambdaproteobacteria bacterium RIFOXYC1_FULL_56_13]OGH03531.1 MAG: transcription termination factor NusA [Candidatus Lambdaproteobacteria bacterium RIFOXYD2_FULL_56_26]OGH09654.1 MAG: transcription termination factor NusA [Candidatus Lambdaproteobacteria bacterium RIFOXYD1_FULL_56_27]